VVAADEQFMAEALVEAERALAAGEFPVGCVLVREGRILARGHRENSCGAHFNELDHAEVVTLRGLLNERPDIDCAGLTVYSTMEPCLMCYATMLLSGIRRFVWAYEDVMGGGTSLDLHQLPPLYAGMQVTVRGRVLRARSLRLFAEFFRAWSYWQDSLLATYTLEQAAKVDDELS